MEKIAFFPGTFDPFSLGHKGVVMEIKKLGYEVYLAIDEFSWSKRTQPKMIRRKLLNMSVADEMNVYLFPDHIPVNLGNPEDLKNLRTLFPHREIYIVVGSDVLENASAYQAPQTDNSIHSFHHIIFQRNDSERDDLDRKKQSEKWERPIISGNVIELTLPRYMEEISSTRIRDNIDFNRDIANLIDPLAQSYIYDHSLYLREPQYKNVFGAKGIQFELVNRFSKKLIGELSKTLLKDQLNPHNRKHDLEKPGVKGVLIRDGEKKNIPVALATFHEAGMAELADEKTVVLTSILFSAGTAIRNLDQLALTEALAYCLQNEYTYAIYRHAWGTMDKELIALLNQQGFQRIMENGEDPIYGVDLKSPVTLFCDIETTVKEPFPRREKVMNAIEYAHKRLQDSLVRMYPGQLILSFDAVMMYHRIMDRITAANHVPKEPRDNRALGASMCVPFGKMLHGMAVPNTVTKSLHTEKRFDPGINRFQIAEFPNYSPLINQIRTIKSFHRPVILVDDLLHKGYRMKELDPLFKQEKIDVSKLIVGILSGRGKDLMTLQGRTVESVYFIPNLHSWFAESNMYPFIGGDSVSREKGTKEGILSSINLILPYVAPNFLKNVPKATLYDFSMICLENARNILSVLEEEYEVVYERKLTLNRLSEALISPRYPDKGSHMSYDPNLAPSVYIANDIETLVRLENLIK
jgi:nicotinic acid mononucleotide adenylyltransferase